MIDLLLAAVALFLGFFFCATVDPLVPIVVATAVALSSLRILWPLIRRFRPTPADGIAACFYVGSLLAYFMRHGFRP